MPDGMQDRMQIAEIVNDFMTKQPTYRVEFLSGLRGANTESRAKLENPDGSLSEVVTRYRAGEGYTFNEEDSEGNLLEVNIRVNTHGKQSEFSKDDSIQILVTGTVPNGDMDALHNGDLAMGLYTFNAQGEVREFSNDREPSDYNQLYSGEPGTSVTGTEYTNLVSAVSKAVSYLGQHHKLAQEVVPQKSVTVDPQKMPLEKRADDATFPGTGTLLMGVLAAGAAGTALYKRFKPNK